MLIRPHPSAALSAASSPSPGFTGGSSQAAFRAGPDTRHTHPYSGHVAGQKEDAMYRMVMVAALLLALQLGSVAQPAHADGSWLDQPLSAWNVPGWGVPNA